jgi:hypothetical protein
MTYKILNKRVQDQILYTEVEYNFDNKIVLVEVAHFNPQSTEEIENNIINRPLSELNNLNIKDNINSLLQNIEVNQVKNINI